MEPWEAVYQVFRRHRSIRKYKPEKIPEEHVRIIMEAGQRAPTDATLHLWTAVRIRDRSIRKEIAEAIQQDHVAEAAEFFVFLADLYRLERLLKHRGVEPLRDHYALLLFAAIDAALAAENMATMAEALGYGTCFIGAVQNAVDVLVELLNLPRLTYPLFGLTIGVPDEEPPLRPRLPLDMLFHEDRYRDYTAAELDNAYKVMAVISRRRDWLRILSRYAASGGYFDERSREMRKWLEKLGFRSI